MNRLSINIVFLLASFFAIHAEEVSVENLNPSIKKLSPLFTKLGKPKPGDWLASFQEDGQTFAQYLKCAPLKPDAKRRVIYIQPLGGFTQSQIKILELNKEFLGLYFNMPVNKLESLPLTTIPGSARRKNPYTNKEQILTTYVLEKILKPRIPDDAFALICLTATDLWPGEGWNFVFGQASLRDRTGVWSIARYGDPDKDEESYKLFLLRTLKTSSHELGHMFTMLHCSAYECNMCGSNSMDESDRRPLALCPECLAKVCWATNTKPRPPCEARRIREEKRPGQRGRVLRELPQDFERKRIATKSTRSTEREKQGEWIVGPSSFRITRTSHFAR